jgi:hypothetical protein
MEPLRRLCAVIVALSPFVPMIEFYDSPGLFDPASRITFVRAIFGTSGDSPRGILLFLAVVPLGALGAILARRRPTRILAACALGLGLFELALSQSRLNYDDVGYRFAKFFLGSGVPRDWFLGHALLVAGFAAAWLAAEWLPRPAPR